jgi:hypothetical protein
MTTGNDRQDQPTIDACHEGLEDPFGFDAKRCSCLAAVGRSGVTFAAVTLQRLVGMDSMVDAGSPDELDGARPDSRHRAIVAISAMLRAAP